MKRSSFLLTVTRSATPSFPLKTLSPSYYSTLTYTSRPTSPCFLVPPLPHPNTTHLKSQLHQQACRMAKSSSTAIPPPQITFDPSQPHVTLPSPFGNHDQPIYRNIRPSFPAKAHVVVNQLNELFASQASNSDSGSPILQWTLAPSCDILYSSFIVPLSQADPSSSASSSSATTNHNSLATLLRQILDAAEVLNHHPELSIIEMRTPLSGHSFRWGVCITVGTHRPAGLSVKDVKLARKVVDIVQGGMPVARGPSGASSRGAGDRLEKHEQGEDEAQEEMQDRSRDQLTRGMARLEAWHWRENLKRASVSAGSMDGIEWDTGQDDTVEEDGGDGEAAEEIRDFGGSYEGFRCWRVNSVQELEEFVVDSATENTIDIQESGINFRGLVL